MRLRCHVTHPGSDGWMSGLARWRAQVGQQFVCGGVGALVAAVGGRKAGWTGTESPGTLAR
jgi:hypothetical protein